MLISSCPGAICRRSSDDSTDVDNHVYRPWRLWWAVSGLSHANIRAYTFTQPHAGLPKAGHYPNSAFGLVTTGNTPRESPLCEYHTDLKTVWIVADTTITYAGQRTSPTTVTICAYASVSPHYLRGRY